MLEKEVRRERVNSIIRATVETPPVLKEGTCGHGLAYKPFEVLGNKKCLNSFHGFNYIGALETALMADLQAQLMLRNY